MFSKATKMVNQWVRTHVSAGDLTVDATCGNGHDTVLLAECVGEEGCVVAVDIQPEAVQATGEALALNGLTSRVDLRVLSHDMLLDVLPRDASIQCVLFNLGYLPGSDKKVITQPDSTVASHQHMVNVLGKGGVIITTMYVGHPGGAEEAKALLDWSARLDAKQFSVARYEWMNQAGSPPIILTIQRRSNQ